jgi:hypothetical protein
MAKPQTETLLKASDYALVRASRVAPALWRALGELEHDLLGSRLERIAIEAPVFVTGLARSGTTMMLTVLSQAEGVATHRYRDFPFLFTPLAWNWFQDRMPAAPAAPVERPHRDRIRITKESAEAFEEPLWQAFFPWTHDPARCHALDASTRHAEFEAFFTSHLRKILWLRGGRRYLSKGNYNVGRIAYLARLFPDARFVVPVREPLSHVRSLVEQHALFCRYAADDPRVARYLAAAGHYEFGPQRRPIHLDPSRLGQIEEAWRAGDDWRGYARQWAQVYDHVARLCADPSLAGRIQVVRYEDACARPQQTVAELLAFTGLGDAHGRVVAAAGTLSAPSARPENGDTAEQVWSEVAPVAVRYGYESPLASRTQTAKAAA